MKARLLAGALALALWGGVAAAAEGPTLLAARAQGVAQEEPGEILDEGFAQEEPGLPVEEELTEEEQEGIGGAGERGVFVAEPDAEVAEVERELVDDEDMRGLTVTVGPGIEGYTGQLAPVLDPGLAWGVTAAIRPTRQFGIELGYSGAVNSLDTGEGFQDVVAEIPEGGEVLRNGGYAALSLGLTTTDVQPYLLGGVGVSRYDVRGAGLEAGLEDDVVGSIPLGGGLRAHIGDFTADARVTVSPLFGNQFAPDVGRTSIFGLDSSAAASYTGTLQLGATF